ncbi:MAG: hypothetical protein CMM32_00230 [Rhodospirillaceae bacterium]|nr:hypothetical protein [Rhodospirillaceae bacterium]|tara:strand:- start:160 stop:1005 length:846 start_codon:yes stop_codon:yes gene_type:complete
MANINATIESLNREGYIVLDNILSPEECIKLVGILESLHTNLSPQYAANAPAKHRLNFHEDEKIVYNLHNKDRAFLNFIDREPIFNIVQNFLRQGLHNKNEPITLRQNTARTPIIGGPQQHLHIDSRIPGGTFPLMVVVTWMLEDFSKQNGATRIVPRSHTKPGFPQNESEKDTEVIITGPRGSAIIMDGAVWHGGGPNQTTNTRWCILSTYTHWFLKPAFDFSKNMPASFYSLLTPRQRQVMGYTSQPPLDEFTRISSRSSEAEAPDSYSLPTSEAKLVE